MAFSIICVLFCSHGKRVHLFSSMKLYLKAMMRYERMVPGEEMHTVITLQLVLYSRWLVSHVARMLAMHARLVEGL